ncbi:MAG: DUF255 domain-containing protein [Fimbriimonas sp.]|nr:DUF255 domain-containing protein [Fimbriimonas sp.]
MPNRLASETSPYLLQHADNPIDWFPWGDEAFEVARETDRPVFLSVGYSSCHWCHVMAHESFEDPEIGELLNREFVCIKVDREERPDVDEAYMTAVQLMTGRGGWPMSLFLTPDRRPFIAGTYWPKEDRGNHPGFRSVCRQVAMAWQAQRKMVEDTAVQMTDALRETLARTVPESTVALSMDFVADAIRTQLADFDPQNGGFGKAPKFPPHTAIELLLRYATLESADTETQEAAVSAALLTLRSMVFGGIHDHVGGGFHRYSTDERWLLPHFEKMLYDNALMLANLAFAVGICAELEPELADTFARAAQRLIDWLLREMTSEDGYFFSAQDADSEGEEGKFYVWTVDEIHELLRHHAPVFLDSYGFEVEGNFEDESTGRRSGANIPHLREDRTGQFEQELEMLRLYREQRVRPGLDDKGLVGWNGLMIGSLADAALWPLAQNAVVAIMTAERKHGRLPHQVVGSVASGDAYLEDYSYLVYGIIRLATCHDMLEAQGELPAQAIPSDVLLGEARRLCEEMVEKFYDRENGGFFATSDRHENLFGRTKPVFDQPIPSANAIAIRCLAHLGIDELARESLLSLLGWMQRVPNATESLYTTALMFLDEPIPVEVDDAQDDLDVAVQEPETVVPATLLVQVSISGRELVADASGTGIGTVTIVVPDGFHLNSSNPPARWLTPTKVAIRGVENSVQYPDATDDRYMGTIQIPFTVQIPGRESGAEFEVVVSFQACTESECKLPEEKTFNAVVVR